MRTHVGASQPIAHFVDYYSDRIALALQLFIYRHPVSLAGLREVESLTRLMYEISTCLAPFCLPCKVVSDCVELCSLCMLQHVATRLGCDSLYCVCRFCLASLVKGNELDLPRVVSEFRLFAGPQLVERCNKILEYPSVSRHYTHLPSLTI